MLTIRLATADELLQRLRLTDPLWELATIADPNWPTREVWGFRGQRDASWRLVPSAFRPGAVLGFKPGAIGPAANPRDQANLERRAVQDLLFLADRVGIDVPGDGQHFRVPVLPGHPTRPDILAWPWESVLDTLAIAQHHGVPTRLLDFSHDPLVAAFFAAHSAWKELGRPSLRAEVRSEGAIAVWALNLPNLYRHVDWRTSAGASPRVVLVTAPRARNSFLHHQDGFFALDLETSRHGYPPLHATFHDVHDELVRSGAGAVGTNWLIKLELAHKQVPRLVELLANEFYNVARLQPTADNVLAALKDHLALVS